MIVQVLISTYNRKEFLSEAISSVLAQTYTDFSLLVVDSGSMDDTFEYLKSINDCRLSVVRFEDNLGISGNIERAMGQVSQRYVVLFHDDDVMEPCFLKTYMDNLSEEVVLYHSDVNFIDSTGHILDIERPVVRGYINKGEYPRLVVTKRREASIVMPTVMIDTKLIKEVVGWPLKLDRRLTMLVDMGIWMQLSVAGGFKFLNRKCLRYRQHKEAGTAVLSKRFFEMLRNRVVLYFYIIVLCKESKYRFFATLFLFKSVLFDLRNTYLK